MANGGSFVEQSPNDKFPSAERCTHMTSMNLRSSHISTSRSVAYKIGPNFRTLGQLPGVSVVNSSNVEYAALSADEACGNGTTYIYYMTIGQVLSRSFTPKDTHTPRGELLVSYTSTDDVDRESSRRAMASAALLGFAAPCFTYGSDLILPASMNAILREVLGKKVLRIHTNAQHAGRRKKGSNELGIYLTRAEQKHHEYASIYIPEVGHTVARIEKGSHDVVRTK